MSVSVMTVSSSEHGSGASTASLARDVEGEVESPNDRGQHAGDEDSSFETLHPKLSPLCLCAAEVWAVVAESAPSHQLFVFC